MCFERVRSRILLAEWQSDRYRPISVFWMVLNLAVSDDCIIICEPIFLELLFVTLLSLTQGKHFTPCIIVFWGV